MKIRIITLIILLMQLSSIVTFSQKTSGPPLVAGRDVAVVQTESGKVRGYIHNGIYTYKGIPYAEAERFMPPSKPKSWQDVRSSLTYGPVCPLMDPTTT